MHASTSQQTSVGPDHTRHGGEVCPVYPRPGHGSSGEHIPLLVNWYRLECGLSGKTMYIYDIQIFEISHSRGRQRRVPVRGRDELRTLFWSCLRSNPSIFGSYTGTIFDDFSKAFTINRWRLRNDRGNVQFYKHERGSEKECSMSIKPLTDLTFDLSSKDDQQRNNSALLTKNLFTQRARYAPEMGDSGWSFVNQWDVCYGSIYRIPRQGDDLETSVKVATGVRAWLGIYNSVKMLEDCTPALAFGLVNRLYYEIEMDLLTFYLDFLEELGLSHERERNPQFLRDMGMNRHQQKRMTNRLSGLRVMTRKFLAWDRYHRPFLSERRMIFTEVVNYPPQTQVFGDMTMAEIYYRLGEPLEYPYLPLCRVSIGNKKYELPMEVLFVHEKPQRYTKTMSTSMKMKFIEGVCRESKLHKKLTEQMFKWMDFENTNMNFLRDFMFSVIPSMISCEGRVLDVPAVVDQDGSKLPMTEKRAIRQKELNEPPSGEIYIAVFIMARRNDRGLLENVCQEADVAKFYEELIEKCRERGLNIAEEPLVRVYKETDAHNFEDYVRDARDRFEKKQDGTKRVLLLLIINGPDEVYDDHGGAYGLIKSICDNKYGIASQVINASTVTNAMESTKKTVYYNIALKINAKLGGVNQAVLFSETSEAVAKDSVMYVGIDVTHPTANSGIDISIASMVANFDLAATKYKNEIFAQMKGKETVECFERQFCRLMTKFHEHSKVWPRHIVILRDGVSDSEMLRTAYIELKWIRDSWKKMTSDDPSLEPTYTYIVIQKRHVTRFYRPSKDEKGKETYVNVPSGTVVDRLVVSPQLFDFYLASQIGAIGTTRPAHYTVVLDEWGLSPDQIYEKCYKLCFLYARCRIPVSLPCPVYYAHVVCEKAKEVYKTLCSEGAFDQFPDTMDGSSLKKIEIERRLSAHENYPGMHFV